MPSNPTLQQHADAAFAEYERVTSAYRFTTAGLKADPALLAHANQQIERRTQVPEAEDFSAYFEQLRQGVPRLLAAQNLGIAPIVIKRKLQFDKAFYEAVVLCEEFAAELIEEKLWKLATVDEERWAMELYLKKRHKTRWGDEPQEINVNGIVKHELDSSGLDEQIQALEAILRERRQLESGEIIDAEVVEDKDV